MPHSDNIEKSFTNGSLETSNSCVFQTTSLKNCNLKQNRSMEARKRSSRSVGRIFACANDATRGTTNPDTHKCLRKLLLPKRYIWSCNDFEAVAFCSTKRTGSAWEMLGRNNNNNNKRMMMVMPPPLPATLQTTKTTPTNHPPLHANIVGFLFM